jgi:hypothetical protein
MKLEIGHKKILKYFLSIFITLSIIISLYPPFEWGKEKLRTLSERRLTSISDELPIKSYDLIFNSNKKQFAIGEYSFEAKYYPEHYDKLNKILSDAISFNYKTGIDTFKSQYIIAYKKSKEILLEEKEKRQKDAEAYKNQLVVYNKELRDFQSGKRSRYPQKPVNVGWSWDDFLVESAENYNEIKNEFKMNPEEWTSRSEESIDSVKNYRLYNIKKPEYYLLNREVLTPELIINYVLSFFISIAFGFLIATFKK